ncbi:MAG: DUF4058 domain-containing protein, partial [Isosphaeraceae bacterium]
ALDDFARKTLELLANRVHVMILDLQPPTARDPRGLHGRIWEDLTGDESHVAPAGMPLTLASYESGATIRAFVEPIGVGQDLPDMPLFLVPGGHVLVPLEATYQTAWNAVPARWREVVSPSD